jgi:hypothetical protein
MTHDHRLWERERLKLLNSKLSKDGARALDLAVLIASQTPTTTEEAAVQARLLVELTDAMSLSETDLVRQLVLNLSKFLSTQAC